MIYDFLIDAIHTVWKNGLTLSSLGAVIFLLLKNRKLKRMISTHLPPLLRDNTDNDIAEIKRDVKAIKAHLGVEEAWHAERGSLEKRTHGKHSLYLWITKSPVLRAVLSMRQQETGRSILSRRTNKMNFLKTNLSKKLVVSTVTILLVALNEKMGLQMSQETIAIIAGLAGVYVAGQAHVDAKKIKSQEGEQFH